MADETIRINELDEASLTLTSQVGQEDSAQGNVTTKYTGQGLLNFINLQLLYRNPCLAATTEALDATYYNGPNNDGIGATLTFNTVGVQEIDQEELSFDSIPEGQPFRVFVKDGPGITHGIYELLTEGDPSTECVLVRPLDYNNVTNILQGTFFQIIGGEVNKGKIYYESLVGPIIVGETIPTFEQPVATDPTKLPLTGGTLSGNLSLGNFAELDFLNASNDADNCLKWVLYDYTGGGLYALSLYSVESGVAKQLFTTFQDDPGVPGQIKYNWLFPKTNTSISLNDQGLWVGAQIPKIVTLSNASPTVSIDAASGNLFKLTLNNNKTISAPSNPREGQTIQIFIQQDSVSSYTVALDSVFVALQNSPAFAMGAVLNSTVCLSATYIGTSWLYSFV